MVLYKYMSFNSANAAIENCSIGFSCLEDLNDPFECAALCFESNYELPNSIQHEAFRNRLSRKYGVLSLTKTPLNPLMWAHYGDDHRGVVIGIDVEMADLNNLSTCVIPASLGEIKYSEKIPRDRLSPPTTESLMNTGNQFSYLNGENSQLFNNAFLHKSTEWKYEEEVRIIKNITSPNYRSRYTINEFSNPAGKWTQIKTQGRPLYCLSIPNESIVEIYLGCSTYKNVSRLGLDEKTYSTIRHKWKEKGIDIKIIHRKPDSWQLEMSDWIA